MTNSRAPGFYKLSIADRRIDLIARAGLDKTAFDGPLLDEQTANHMIENVVGIYGLPLGIAFNFQINGKDFLVPMCVEEPSVVAAASNAAKMIRAGGGFIAEADEPIMISQVQLTDVADTFSAKRRIEAEATELMVQADAAYPSLVKRGGGVRGIEVRVLEESRPAQKGMLAVHLLIDVRDAMGANLVNTIAEAMSDRLARLADGRVGLRILSNLADKRLVRVKARIPASALAGKDGAVDGGFGGERVRDGIVSASRFAELDPYRAATHNKGIMNGVDAVVMATGNDWRGVEAGAHAFAATRGEHGGYGPLCIWRAATDGSGDLLGSLEIPMAVGTVGGTLRVHPGAKLALKILGVERAWELGMVMAAAGMASNLAALRALASEGIQRGHMSLHARSVALHAGATAEQVERVASEMSALGDVRHERALSILAEIQTQELAKPRLHVGGAS